MFEGDTGRVSRPVVIVVAVLVVTAVSAGLLFGTDLLRDSGVAADVRAGQEPAQGPASTQPATEAAAGAPGQLAASAAPRAGAPAAQPDAAAESMDTTLVLTGGDVLVSYPEGFGLAVTQEQLQVSSQIPPCDEGFDYCIYLASGAYDGTNFSSAAVRIQQRDDLTTEADCVLAQPGGYSGLVPVIAGASDFATTMYQPVDQGAAGHFSRGSLGRLYYESVCYEFEPRVAQAQFSNFPTGTLEEFDADDLDTTEGLLMSVLDSVTLPDGRSGLWARKVPAARPGSPAGEEAADVAAGREAAVPIVAEPVSGSVVSSPLRVSGEAPGTWFFEATFPYRLVAADGTELTSGTVTAGGDWMTEAPVAFEASIEFEVTTETNAVLVLSKENPSGLPEHDASYEVPLLLLP